MTDMTPREAVEVLRAEALGWNWLDDDAPESKRAQVEQAIATLSALADRAGEPVAWIVHSGDAWITQDIDDTREATMNGCWITPLFALSPATPGESHDR